MINVTRSSMPGYHEYCEEIKDLWDSRWLTNMGSKHKELETNLKDYLKCENLKLYTNGHLALENILELMDFPKDSEVITTPYTFISTTHAIVRCGLTPIFCDVNDSDYTIDVNKIENLITDKTVAIMAVHVYGSLCDVEAIKKIADKHNLKVIYDAAHAFGVSYKGVSSACFGDASMYSFHATKVFHTVEGGAVTFSNSDYENVFNTLRSFGTDSNGEITKVGGNAKMSEFHAAMGICNLRHIDEEINKRKTISEHYDSKLKNISGITLMCKQKDVQPNYIYYPIVFDGYKYTRDEIFVKLKENGIMARKYFYPLCNDVQCYQGLPNFDKSKTPIAERIANNVLTLPLYSDLDLCIVDKICGIILE